MPSTSPQTEISRSAVVDIISDPIVLLDMFTHAHSKPDEEVVGAVLLDKQVIRLVNEDPDPSAHITVSPEQLANLDAALIAVYHSHPSGGEQPSVSDEKGLSPIPAVIITPTSAILWWWLERDTGSFYYRIWDHNGT